MRAFLNIGVILLIAGCASSHPKLQSYVGKDIQNVVVDYGYPIVAYEMGDGRRDSQWVMDQSSSRSTQVMMTGALTEPAEQFEPNIKTISMTAMSGDLAKVSQCMYTMITRWDDEKKTWIIKGYQKPTSDC